MPFTKLRDSNSHGYAAYSLSVWLLVLSVSGCGDEPAAKKVSYDKQPAGPVTQFEVAEATLQKDSDRPVQIPPTAAIAVGTRLTFDGMIDVSESASKLPSIAAVNVTRAGADGKSIIYASGVHEVRMLPDGRMAYELHANALREPGVYQVEITYQIHDKTYVVAKGEIEVK